uniref:Kunitz-type serine protease inhibitor PILP-3-like isoform X1 n=1 Tax=Crassostrea virginica TaxID=6565 RepID=A0A8B8C141_CRAVI|nr:kunitz-type serine protease inhibitor PILP-3-like isoform X1 [Crassostrea virginica]
MLNKCNNTLTQGTLAFTMMKTGIVALFLALTVVCVGARYRYAPGPVGNPCRLPPDAGYSQGICPRWYYDARLRSCRQFNYGCCGGNANNFKTRRLCEDVCGEDILCPLWVCDVGACTIQTCPNFPKATCFAPCPCTSVWIYNGEDVTDRCNN